MRDHQPGPAGTFLGIDRAAVAYFPRHGEDSPQERLSQTGHNLTIATVLAIPDGISPRLTDPAHANTPVALATGVPCNSFPSWELRPKKLRRNSADMSSTYYNCLLL